MNPVPLRKYISFAFFLLILFAGKAQSQSSSEILHDFKKLKNTGTVLYLAAHPDDENTGLIAWLNHALQCRTGYLSLTRGDGGQNLIGPERGAALGILRTQELLAARRIDGAEQFFTRAVDFGYSKSPTETFEKWGYEDVLQDVVWVIRKFQPDVIITRFPDNGEGGHGHHTASAMLAKEAFEIANDESRFSSQLEFVQAWKPKLLVHNTSLSWYPDLEESAQGNNNYFLIDIGSYNTELGKSYTEIAAESRSQHKSQGFGTSPTYGSKIEFLEYISGDKNYYSFFQGAQPTWNSMKSGIRISKKIDDLIANFQPASPQASIPDLLVLYNLIDELPRKSVIVKKKIDEIKNLLLACSGLNLNANSKEYFLQSNDSLETEITVINRSSFPIILEKIWLPGKEINPMEYLKENDLKTWNVKHKIPTDAMYSEAYWLKEKYENLFSVSEMSFLGLPENHPSIEAIVDIKIENEKISYHVPLKYRWTDPVAGALQRDLEIVPELSVSIEEKVVVVPEGMEHIKLHVNLKAYRANVQGTIELLTPSACKLNTPKQLFEMSEKGAEKNFEFNLVVSSKFKTGTIKAKVEIPGKGFSKSISIIDHPHIEPQIYFEDAICKVVKIDLKKVRKNLAYIPGSGDEIMENLKNIGYNVDLLLPDQIAGTHLAKYDAILTGIRAWNTSEDLAANKEKLLDYVKNGGHLVVQYCTSQSLLTEEFAPFPIHLSRDRVTDENATVTFLDRKHSLMYHPNILNEKDFDGWVQERGLYFADSWDKKFTPLLAWHDQGEKSLEGALLVCDYGMGSFIYTGISFFRQLPEGIPGAFRLLSNIVEYQNPKSARKK